MTTPAVFEIVLLTPPGRGAVATVLVSGPQAVDCIERFFEPAAGIRLSEASTDRPMFGRWRNRSQAGEGEELVVRKLSPTDVEIHCHGGVAAWRAIADALLEVGGVEVNWQTHVGVNSANRISADARLALAAARTQRAAGILLDQLQGALWKELTAVVTAINANDSAHALQQLSVLCERSRMGLHLTQPWRVVLAGRPNVGKSSLMNALLGYERVIVFDQPGTTRDVVTATAAFDGWPVELADTAGLRLASDEIEQAGIAKAKSTVAGADLTVLVFDAAASWSEDDAALAAAHPQAIIVHNKIDRLEKRLLDDRPAGIAISALHRQNVDQLLAEIVRRLVGEGVPLRGAAMPFTSEQAETILLARREGATGNWPEVVALLEKLLS